MRQLVLLMVAGIFLGSCATLGTATPPPTTPPSPSPTLAISCDQPPKAPLTRLTCDAAVTAALAVPGVERSAIRAIEFHYGLYCAMTSGYCLADCATGGYVVLHGANTTGDEWVTVRGNAQGVVVSAILLGRWPPPGGIGLDRATCAQAAELNGIMPLLLRGTPRVVIGTRAPAP